MHASISSSALIFGQTYASDAEEITWTAISVGLDILAATVIWIFVRKQEATEAATTKLSNYGWSKYYTVHLDTLSIRTVKTPL